MSVAFDRDGFEVLPGVLPEEVCDLLARELGRLFERHRNSAAKRRGGVRNMLRDCQPAAELARSDPLRRLIEAALGPAAFPVRGIFFDKTPETNWRVPWHQDLTITVAEQVVTEGFGPWSVKDGVVHVQPPAPLLARMATIRLHLDDCPADNGALRVIPGSHLHGELSATQIEEFTRTRCAVVCEIPRGGVLLLRPLLLHASSPASVPAHRRVLHLEYAAERLPNGLKWTES